MNFVAILDFFVSQLKNWPPQRGYCVSWGRALADGSHY